jgi:DNA-binding response OmpR family regulator
MQETILIIDDDEQVLTGLKRYLEQEEFKVLATNSAEGGLKILQHRRPDMIILDLKMPGMSGLSFLKEIAGEGGKLKYPVLVLTAYATMSSFFKYVDVDGFMLKPCHGDELVAEVRRIMAKYQTSAKPAEAHRRRKLILGEDEGKVIARLSDKLVDAGYTVLKVDNASDVIARAILESPDVVVIKGVFPQMNGDRLTALLREIPKTSTLPVVMYDASGYMSSKAKQFSDDARGPFRMVMNDGTDDILKALESVLG